MCYYLAGDTACCDCIGDTVPHQFTFSVAVRYAGIVYQYRGSSLFCRCMLWRSVMRRVAVGECIFFKVAVISEVICVYSWTWCVTISCFHWH